MNVLLAESPVFFTGLSVFLLITNVCKNGQGRQKVGQNPGFI